MHGCGYPGERLKNIVHDVRGYMFRIHSKYMRFRRTMMSITYINSNREI